MSDFMCQVVQPVARKCDLTRAAMRQRDKLHIRVIQRANMQHYLLRNTKNNVSGDNEGTDILKRTIICIPTVS